MPMAFLCGFVMGFLICFTGVGGGVLIIPAIVYFFDLDVSVAIGTASVYATLTKIVAGVEHVRNRQCEFSFVHKAQHSGGAGGCYRRRCRQLSFDR